MNNIFQIILPKENANDEYNTILSTPFNDGDKVETGDIILEYETSKADIELESEYTGFIKYFCKKGEKILPGSIIVKIYSDSMPDNFLEIPENDESHISEQLFSKKALELIAEYNLNTTDFSNENIVTSKTILHRIPDTTNKAAETEVIDESHPISSNISLSKKVEPNKSREITQLQRTYRKVIPCTQFISIRLSDTYNFVYANAEMYKTSILPTVVTEASKLLRLYPEMNAYYSEEFIHYYKDVNIGFAIDLDNGLKVLTIYNSDELSFNEIEIKISELSNKYFDGKLEKADLINSSFTITDLTSEGPDFFAPVLNENQSAILGIGNMDWGSGKSVFSLTFDHRVMSGKYASKFLNDLKGRLQSYYSPDGNNSRTDIRCYKCNISLNDNKKLNEHFNNVGFLKVMDYSRNNNYVCTNCLNEC